MRSQFWKTTSWIIAALAAAMLMNGCSGSSSSTTAGTSPTTGSTAKVSLDVTDAPSIDYAHVYVTITGVAFHTDSTAGFDSYSTSKAAGWQTIRLASPKTVDLAQLSNGIMYADTNNGSSLFDGIDLPTGKYRQIRILLASTEDAYIGTVAGLTYNNEVMLNGDTSHYPLRVPNAEGGIRLIPEAPVVVTSGTAARIAVDFNLNNDVVQVAPNGTTEFILKSRLGYFDMNSVGCVKGTVSFGNLSTSRFVIKAEQVNATNDYRIVRRVTTVDKASGAFKFYPLPIFGNATTATYDILLRGRNVQTAIIKGVVVHKGSSPATGAVDLGAVSMQPGTEFTAQLTNAMHPSGAWLNFYQTVAGDTIPYEVRNRHLDPYTGKLRPAMELSADPILVASYIAGQTLSFSADSASQGSFTVVADASGYYGKGAPLTLNGSSGQTVLLNNGAANNPQVMAPATKAQITAEFDMMVLGSGKGHGMGLGQSMAAPTKGQLFVTDGGMILDSIGTLGNDPAVGTAMHNGGGQANPVTIDNVPGGVAGAHYGIYALGWNNATLAAGSTHVNLSGGNGTTIATIKMR